jgi:hypothetical protein
VFKALYFLQNLAIGSELKFLSLVSSHNLM